MSEGAADFEALVRRAMPPVEPPAELEVRLEMTLGSLVEAAADEFEAWELSAMRDPRNWVRLAGAGAIVVVGSGAAVALVVLRTQRRRHRRRAQAVNVVDLAGRTLHDAAQETRRVIRNARR